MPQETGSPVKRRPLRWLRAAVVAERLGLNLSTFRQSYQSRFTDGRPPDKRVRRVPVLIPDDEVELVEADGWEALPDYRRRLGRLRPDER